MFSFSYTTMFNLLFACLFVSFPGRKLGDPVSRVVIRCAPNRLHEFYNVLSLWRRETVGECIFLDFFKCRQTGLSGYLVEYLIEIPSQWYFILNNHEVYMGLKDVADIRIESSQDRL